MGVDAASNNLSTQILGFGAMEVAMTNIDSAHEYCDQGAPVRPVSLRDGLRLPPHDFRAGS